MKNRGKDKVLYGYNHRIDPEFVPTHRWIITVRRKCSDFQFLLADFLETEKRHNDFGRIIIFLNGSGLAVIWPGEVIRFLLKLGVFVVATWSVELNLFD